MKKKASFDEGHAIRCRSPGTGQSGSAV